MSPLDIRGVQFSFRTARMRTRLAMVITRSSAVATLVFGLSSCYPKYEARCPVRAAPTLAADADGCAEILERGGDFFNNTFAMCPAENIGASCGTPLAQCSADGAGPGEFPDTNKNPVDAVFVAFFDGAVYGACHDLLRDDPHFRQLAERLPLASEADASETIRDYTGPGVTLPPPDRLQRAMVTVLRQLGAVSFCHADYYAGPQRRALGRYLPASREIVIYQGACTTESIYGASLSRAAVGGRAYLVAAHEVGHLLDHAVGDFDCKRSRREERATIYGARITACLARAYQNVVRVAAVESPETRRYVECFAARTLILEELMQEIYETASDPSRTLSESARADGSINCLE